MKITIVDSSEGILNRHPDKSLCKKMIIRRDMKLYFETRRCNEIDQHVIPFKILSPVTTNELIIIHAALRIKVTNEKLK
jgi:hypothetical protein